MARSESLKLWHVISRLKLLAGELITHEIAVCGVRQFDGIIHRTLLLSV